MNHFSKIFRYILLVTIVAILFLPLLQSKLNVVELKPLKGDVTYPPQAHFAISDWFSSKYQEEKETYLNAMFGFRSTCVRINNQIAYSLFNHANANGVIIGKENYLYEESYINSYNGNDFVGEDSLNHTIERIKSINNSLNILNKKLIIVLAPSKASFFPEYIPDKYLPIKKQTNYKYFSEKLKNSKLDVIDFNKWFIENREKSKYPLYPKLGIHWSVYASVLVADSILKFVGNKIERPISKINIEDILLSDPKDADLDIAEGANLLFKINSHKMAYPVLTLNCLVDTNKPSLLVVGDSYYWSINVLGIGNCFKKEK